MLEGVVSSLLERVLGEFVEGFNAGNVNLSLFSTKSGIGLSISSWFPSSLFVFSSLLWL